MSLSTGKQLSRRNWTELPITAFLAEREKQLLLQNACPLFVWAPDQPITDRIQPDNPDPLQPNAFDNVANNLIIPDPVHPLLQDIATEPFENKNVISQNSDVHSTENERAIMSQMKIKIFVPILLAKNGIGNISINSTDITTEHDNNDTINQ